MNWTKPPESAYSIQALQKGLRILDLLLEAECPLRLEQICLSANLPKSTAFRLVTNLLSAGYLVPVAEGYWFSHKMIRFGAIAAKHLDLVDQARPYLSQLRNRFNETVHLAVHDDDFRVVYVEKLVSSQAIGLMKSHVGGTAPMYCTGLGKAMAAFVSEEDVVRWLLRNELQPFSSSTITDKDAFLAELSAIRQRGYSTDEGEHEVGVRCVAAPLRDGRSEVVGAISIAGPDTRMPSPLIGSDMAVAVLETASTISSALGFSESRLSDYVSNTETDGRVTSALLHPQ